MDISVIPKEAFRDAVVILSGLDADLTHQQRDEFRKCFQALGAHLTIILAGQDIRIHLKDKKTLSMEADQFLRELQDV